MKSDEKRSHRLNYLLKCYLTNPTENDLYKRAKQMGVSDSTAKDYIRTVIIQAQKIYSK
jgi:dihydroorotase